MQVIGELQPIPDDDGTIVYPIASLTKLLVAIALHVIMDPIYSVFSIPLLSLGRFVLGESRKTLSLKVLKFRVCLGRAWRDQDLVSLQEQLR